MTSVSGPSGLSLFVVAALILAVTPGPAVLYIVTRSVSQGRSAGIVSCAGVACGGLVHVAAAAFGLSAILTASATAFGVVKYAGAAYLVWLGVRKFADPSAIQDVDVVVLHSLMRVFREGVIVNVLNPKTALFFLAFLPQFVVPARGSVSGQFLLLGMVFVAIAFCTDTSWCLLASTARTWLRRHPAAVGSERCVAGCVYIGLGLAAAVSGGGRR
jgi:threonine/homoserine/homoserine lactone efflux protein